MAVNNLNTPGVGIQPSLIDAKGDLLVGTGNDAIDRLGVTGPTGSVLVTDAGETTGLKWVDPGTVGGLVHIETQTFSAVSAVSFNDVFSATYDNYKITSNIKGSGVLGVIIRLRVGGSDNSSTNYRSQYLNADHTSLSGERLTGQTGFIYGLGIKSSTDMNIGVLELANPFATEYTAGRTFNTIASSGNIELRDYALGINVTTSYTGFSAIASSGTMTGSISVYGYKK